MANRYRELVNDDTNSNYGDYDYEELDALEWRNPTEITPTNEEIRKEPLNIPDKVWMIPSNLSSNEILGEKNINKRRIEDYTNTHIDYNKSEGRMDMWGAPEDLEEAYLQWNTLAENLVEKKRKKGKSWEKPEKAPLNKKQKEKIERRKKRELEKKIYTKRSESKFFPFSGYFVFPKTEIDVKRFLGKGNEILNPLRIEKKCHIWYEPTQRCSNIIRIDGDSHETVEEASERVKYLFMKVFSSKSIPDKGWVLHMIDPLHEPHKVRIAKPPTWFHPPYDESEFRLLEPVHDGGNIPVVGEEENKKLTPSFNFNAIQTICESNIKKFEDAFVKALETVHLLDQEIKMRIRFGFVCLTHFPQPKQSKTGDGQPKTDDGEPKTGDGEPKTGDGEPKTGDGEPKTGDGEPKTGDDQPKQVLWPIDKFNERVMKNPRVKSKFATCLTTEEEQLSRLKEFLSKSNDPKRSQAWDGSPFREFKIRAYKVNGSKESYPCTFDIKFEKVVNEKNEKKKDENDEKRNDEEDDKKYRIGSWNAVVYERDVLSVSMSCLKNDYSWKLNLQTAKCLSNEKFHPQGNFVYRLRFDSQDRLVYSNTKEIIVVSVCEKTKWKYWWNKDYVVEVTKYEFWDLSKYEGIDPGIEIPLIREPSPKVSYGVTLYKRSWDEDFALNRCLNVGEVPEWHPHDIMNIKETGGVNALLNDIQKFLEELQSNLPAPKV